MPKKKRKTRIGYREKGVFREYTKEQLEIFDRLTHEDAKKIVKVKFHNMKALLEEEEPKKEEKKKLKKKKKKGEMGKEMKLILEGKND